MGVRECFEPDSNVSYLALERARRCPQLKDRFNRDVHFVLLRPQPTGHSLKFKRPFESEVEFSEFRTWLSKLLGRILYFRDEKGVPVTEKNCVGISHIFFQNYSLGDDEALSLKDQFRFYEDATGNIFFLNPASQA